MASQSQSQPSGAKSRRRPPMRYGINMDRFGAVARSLLEPTFVQCGADRETQEWLRSVSRPSKLKAVLSDYLTAKWMCRTSANGLLGRGTMFVLSTAQAAALLFGAVQEPLASDVHPSLLSRAVDPTTSDMTSGSLKAAASPLETGVSLTTPPNPAMATMSPADASPTPDELANGLCCGTIRGRSGAAHQTAQQPTLAMPTSACVAPLAPAEAYKNAFGTLLDIGAGDGGVTSRLAPFCRHVAATEASYPMQWRLWQRGYEVLSIEESEKRKYDVISFLNVLDRCDRPFTLLKQLRERLNQPSSTAPPTGVCGAACGGKLLIAVVLPWCPFVEDGTRKLPPTETLNMDGGRCADKAPFETCVEKLVMNVFRPAGYRVVRWTRVPYLCEGNTTHEYFVLDDAVFVLESDSRATPLSVSEATAGSVGKNCVQ